VTPSSGLSALDDCLQRQILAGERLIEAMRAETEALRTGSAADIEAALGPKQDALEAFRSLDTEREQLLASGGWKADRETPEDWISSQDHPIRDAALARWRRLLEIAGECGRQNLINGALIQAGLRHSRQLLDLLSGRPPEESAAYGPAPKRAASGHSLGKA
jgi:flagellar biosynthesis/type III secretory pathway chaperone